MDDGDDFSGGRAAAARREELSRQAQLEETNHQQRQDEHQAMVNLEGYGHLAVKSQPNTHG